LVVKPNVLDDRRVAKEHPRPVRTLPYLHTTAGTLNAQQVQQLPISIMRRRPNGAPVGRRLYFWGGPPSPKTSQSVATTGRFFERVAAPSDLVKAVFALSSPGAMT
jgi:hypothetical protein